MREKGDNMGNSVVVFTRDNIKPVLEKIIRDPINFSDEYESFEEEYNDDNIFEENDEPEHISPGEPGYEERAECAVRNSLYYFIGDDEYPEEYFVNYLNNNLHSISSMKIVSPEVFSFLKKAMLEYVKSDFFLEEMVFEYGPKALKMDPFVFLKSVLPVDKISDRLLDDKHKYVFIDGFDDSGTGFKWGNYTVLSLVYLRDDCRLFSVKEHQYEVWDGNKFLLNVIRERPEPIDTCELGLFYECANRAKDIKLR